MRKYFIGSSTVSANANMLTQELEKFPALEENCNIDINDDSIGTNFTYSFCCTYADNLINNYFNNCFNP